MTPRREALPQRELVLELRFQIDHARAVPRDAEACRRRVRRLIDDNPAGFASSHVQHNIGKERMEWLTEMGLAAASSATPA